MITFLGERSDVPRLMAAADIYCQPNTGPEPFGIAFVEALAAGVPVVTTAIGGAVEIVDARCGILVDAPSPVLVAEALQRLIDSPALRASLAAAGPARASRSRSPGAADGSARPDSRRARALVRRMTTAAAPPGPPCASRS